MAKCFHNYDVKKVKNSVISAIFKLFRKQQQRGDLPPPSAPSRDTVKRLVEYYILQCFDVRQWYDILKFSMSCPLTLVFIVLLVNFASQKYYIVKHELKLKIEMNHR